MLDSVLTPASAAYVSGPLQTGWLYYQAKSGHGPRPDEVRNLNGVRLSQFVETLRGQLAYPVIDPGLLFVDGWSGSQYLTLYLEILRRYAKEVWFIDGWEYSRGATTEYRTAIERGVPCFNSSGDQMTLAYADELISVAAKKVAGLGMEAAVCPPHAA
jgi:hypothetical protein